MGPQGAPLSTEPARSAPLSHSTQTTQYADPGPREQAMAELNMNTYATKKTVTKGLLDIALLTANSSQLKSLLQDGEEHEFYTLLLILIVLSILFQVAVGIVFLILGATNINDDKHHRTANILDNISMSIVFIIVLNVIISSFGVHKTG